jgi:hypothetical protein
VVVAFAGFEQLNNPSQSRSDFSTVKSINIGEFASTV